MDEPFSALDVLTAENLRSELLELWAEEDHAHEGSLSGDAQHRRSGAQAGSFKAWVSCGDSFILPTAFRLTGQAQISTETGLPPGRRE